MKLQLAGRGIEISDALRSFVENKLSTFERHLKEVEEGEVEVVITFIREEPRERNRVNIDVYLKTPGGGSLHAWEESNDIYGSLEFALDDIDRQLKRLKDRRLEWRRKAADEKTKNMDEMVSVPVRDLVVEEKLSIAKPITVEEALMILLDKDDFFLAFRNADTGELNVIYRKKSGLYGLISP